MLGLFGKKAAGPRGAKGYRAYVVGDVHGRLDLLNQLLEQIEDDLSGRPPRETILVFLGDLIDRGPDSAGVIERLRNYQRPGVRTVFLAGNHEEVLLRVLRGDYEVLTSWLRFGGAECLRSYRLDPARIAQMRPDEAIQAVFEAIPEAHSRFIAHFGDTFSFGDYLFVHAGIRPGVPLDRQRQKDLRWIRAPFLSDESDHGKVVVHGHTICLAVEERSNRIGIDTGAYRSGILTALAIEDGQRWFLATEGAEATAVPATH